VFTDAGMDRRFYELCALVGTADEGTNIPSPDYLLQEMATISAMKLVAASPARARCKYFQRSRKSVHMLIPVTQVDRDLRLRSATNLEGVPG
jgi:hypothetical protein